MYWVRLEHTHIISTRFWFTWVLHRGNPNWNSAKTSRSNVFFWNFALIIFQFPFRSDSYVCGRDSHIITVDQETFISDGRFVALKKSKDRLWTLQASFIISKYYFFIFKYCTLNLFVASSNIICSTMSLISLGGNFDGLSLDFANTIKNRKVNILAINHWCRNLYSKLNSMSL